MNKVIALAFFLISCIAAIPVSAQQNPSFADAIEKVTPSVISISAMQNIPQNMMMEIPQFPPGSPFEQFFKDFRPVFPQENKSISIGSGFILDASGIAMTNVHVVENSEEITVTFHDGSTAKASLLSFDKKTDIALLKIDTGKQLIPVKFGNSDKIRIGDWIFAIGNPFGLGSTVTKGIVSARARDIQAGPYDDFIQTDAPINRGNSGGPMFNMNGEVIGINTAIFSPSGGNIGIGFAIPSNIASSVYQNLITHGKIRRGQIGVRIQSITNEISEILGLPEKIGILVAGVDAEGSGNKAGLQTGDVILSFDGIDITSIRQLPKLVANSPIGETKTIVIWRNGKKSSLKITVEEMQEASPSPPTISQTETDSPSQDIMLFDNIGVTVTNITPETRERFRLTKNARGVIVTNVRTNSEAFHKGLKVGDVIVEIKQTPVNKTVDMEGILKAAKEQNLKSVLILVDSKEGLKFIALKLK